MAPNKPEAKKDAKKVKIPHAIKTHKQSLKRNAINRAFKSKVRTFINHFEAAIKSNSSAEILREKLNDVYSLMDKGVKRGVFKQNKADRTKSRFHERLVKATVSA